MQGTTLFEALDEHLYDYGNLSSWKGKKGPPNKSSCRRIFLYLFALASSPVESQFRYSTTCDRRSNVAPPFSRKRIHRLEGEQLKIRFDPIDVKFLPAEEWKVTKYRSVGISVLVWNYHRYTQKGHISQIRVIALSHCTSNDWTLVEIFFHRKWLHVPAWHGFIKERSIVCKNCIAVTCRTVIYARNA